MTSTRILTPNSTPPSCPAVLDPQWTLLKGYQPYHNPEDHHTYLVLPQPSTPPHLPSPSTTPFSTTPTATLHPTTPSQSYHNPPPYHTYPALPQPSTLPHHTYPALPQPSTLPFHSCSVSLSHSLSFSSHIFVDSVCIPFLIFITFYCWIFYCLLYSSRVLFACLC